MDGQRMTSNSLHPHRIGYEVFSHHGEEDMEGIITHIFINGRITFFFVTE